MFIQVINILAGVRNYSYLDLLQKPSFQFFSHWLDIA